VNGFECLHPVLGKPRLLTTLMKPDQQYHYEQFPKQLQLFSVEEHPDLPNLSQLCDAIYPSELQ
jgi:hypothetical protein